MDNKVDKSDFSFAKDSRSSSIATLSHVVALFCGILGPLVIWLLMKDENSFIEEHSRNSLNWQISVAIYGIVFGVLAFILVGYLLLPLLVIWNIISIVLASVAAYNGKSYTYKFSLHLVK